jgi:hypothetical protein
MELSEITSDPDRVRAEVESVYRDIYSEGDDGMIAKAFDSVTECFRGHFEGYQAIDAKYHDFEHTMQGTLCLAYILQGRHRSRAEPAVDSRFFELILLAILLHDSGYLKTNGDNEGTGAKYTLIHVRRSAEFARWFMKAKGFGDQSIKAVQNMIACTGVNARLDGIPFRNELERTGGHCLATADLLGQMAAEDYVQKLPVLYSEFREAAHYSKSEDSQLHRFQSANDLMVKTPEFWEFYVKPKIEIDFMAEHRHLNFLPSSKNVNYIQKIERNIDRLKARLRNEGLL